MKRNPRTNIKISDNSPVMRCRTIRRRKMNGCTDAQGVMEHIPYSRGYYRPTKGHFGRE